MTGEREPRRLPAQLTVDGREEQIVPGTEAMRLFNPAPTQLAGQSYLDLDSDNNEKRTEQ
jgi:hypothetical protein